MKPNQLNAILMPIESIKISTKNEKIHDEDNIKLLRKGLKKFVQQKPIVIDKNNEIIAGHGLFLAAKKIGWTHINVVVSELDGKEIDAYRVYDNKSAEKSIWDEDKLGETLYELEKEGYSLIEYGLELDEFKYEPIDESKDQKTDNQKIQLTVIFENQDQQQDLFDELRDRGFKVKL